MRIIFVRHGHPNYADDCLTPLGHLQAEAAAQRLQQEGILQIFSSTCGRAFETAEHTARALSLPVVPCDFMREITWGATDDQPLFADGHPWTITDRMVEEGRSLLSADWTQEEEFRRNRLLGCVRHIATEMDAWLAELGYQREGLYYRVTGDTRRTIAVFYHGGASAAMLSHLYNLPFPFVCTAMGPDYTGITIASLPDGEGKLVAPRFELLNDARHIQGLRAENIYGN